MKLISKTNNYELMLIVSSNCNDVELRNVALKYIKKLKRLGVLTISVISRGQRNFAYAIKKVKTGYFVEMYFNSSPLILPSYETKLRLDKDIIRFLTTKI